MEAIIKDLIDTHMSEMEKHIEEAFQKHFGISIHDVDLREIEHMTVNGDPIGSYRYRGETFLYIQELLGDVEYSKDGSKLMITTQYREV